MPFDYPSAYTTLLKPLLQAKKSISLDTLLSDASVGSTARRTKLKHLKAFMTQNPEYLGVVEGLLPDDDAIVKLIENRIGSRITEANIVRANKECAKIVMSAARPVLETFVTEALDQHISGAKVSLPVADLIDFLLDDYGPFARGAGNSLISTAGRMNEKLLMVCLEAAGMAETTDYTKTGKRSEGDIVIHCNVGAKTNLGVEVKSYHARERLQRGLTDVSEPKVGAGYFINPSEFGASRTSSLIQTMTAAVYLPTQTLKQINKSTRDMTVHDKIAVGSRFYRPLEQFATDMKAYSKTGKLPKF